MGIITSWNKSAEKIYGYREDEVVGWPISLLVPPGSEDEVRQILDKIKNGEYVEHYATLESKIKSLKINKYLFKKSI